MAVFQESGSFSAESHMIRRVEMEDLGTGSEYTLCARFSLLHERGSHSSTFLSYGNNISDNFIKGGEKCC